MNKDVITKKQKDLYISDPSRNHEYGCQKYNLYHT